MSPSRVVVCADCRLAACLPAETSLATVRVCTVLLKEAAAAGLTAHHIAAMMTRPYARRGEVPQLSELEKIIAQAKTTALVCRAVAARPRC